MQTGPRATPLDSIRALRGIAVLLVLFSHMVSVEAKYAGDQILGSWGFAGFAGVDLFFVISGFIMVYVTQSVPNDVGSSWRFLLARSLRIYPLYWLVSLAVLLVWWQAPHLVFASEPKAPDLLRSFLLLPDVRDPLLPVGWTLIHEMYFYVVFAGLLLLKRNWLPIGLLAWALIIGVGYWQTGSAAPPFAKLVFSPLSFEFLGGTIAAFAYVHWRGQNWQMVLVIGAGLFVLGLGYFAVLGPEQWSALERALVFAPSASLLMYGLVGMESAGRGFSSILIWIGDQSYALYLTHLLTLSVIGRVWAMIAVDGPVDNVLALVVLLGLSLVVGQLTYVFCEKPLLRLAYFLRAKWAR